MRYTSVRRQTAPRPGEPELQVLDYQNVALDLLPMVASAYALIFMVSLLPSPPAQDPFTWMKHRHADSCFMEM